MSVLQRCPLRESRLFLCLLKILSYQEQALIRENEIFSLGFDTLCSKTVALILQVAEPKIEILVSASIGIVA